MPESRVDTTLQLIAKLRSQIEDLMIARASLPTPAPTLEDLIHLLVDKGIITEGELKEVVVKRTSITGS